MNILNYINFIMNYKNKTLQNNAPEYVYIYIYILLLLLLLLLLLMWHVAIHPQRGRVYLSDL